MEKNLSEVLTVGAARYELLLVEAGTFTMGATPEMELEDDWFTNDKPAHKVTLTRDYYMGRTAVTRGLWKAVMGCYPEDYPTVGDDNKPATHVSWKRCKEFIEKLNELTGKNFRFPTEAEWEFAARGGNKSKGYRYSGSDNLDEVAWYGENSGEVMHDVATKKPNELGLYDMSGNVLEWCSDEPEDYTESDQTDPHVQTKVRLYHIYRGGSWLGCEETCRSSHRASESLNWFNGTIGLRLALSAE